MIQNWKPSTDVTDLQSFLGLANYYRGFVKNFSQLALPLLRLTEGNPKKNSPIQLDDEAKQSFQEIKNHLTGDELLAHPDFGPNAQKFILDTDWSENKKTISGILSQPQPNKAGELQERVIYFSSKKLNKAQQRYR